MEGYRHNGAPGNREPCPYQNKNTVRRHYRAIRQSAGQKNQVRNRLTHTKQQLKEPAIFFGLLLNGSNTLSGRALNSDKGIKGNRKFNLLRRFMRPAIWVMKRDLQVIF
jgi:hypothetical protein